MENEILDTLNSIDSKAERTNDLLELILKELEKLNRSK